MVKLKKYQQIPINFMKENRGLILNHRLGSGKTITALVAMYQFKCDIIIVGPKSSKKIFEDEIIKLKLDRSRFTIFTYQKLKNILMQQIEFFNNKCVIVDEAHHLRNETKDSLLISSSFYLAKKIMLLTATPVINYPNDIAPLVNIIKKNEVMPTDKDLFNFFYFDTRKVELKNEHLILDKMRNSISFYEKIGSKNYPKEIVYNKKIYMNKTQVEEYSKYVIKIIYDDIKPPNINIFDIKFDLLKTKKKNSFLTSTRQLSNTLNGSTDFPKIQAVFDQIEKGHFPAVVYSNYLKNGIYPFAVLFNKKNINVKMITGTTSSDKINQIVNDYNSGKIQVLLLSSAGSESLNLMNTRQLHILEPHWNESKIEQAKGRVVRYKSHNGLPLDLRFVEIYRWASIFPLPFQNQSADEYLLELSQRKLEMFNKFKKIIIDSSIEKNWYVKMQRFYYKYKKYKYKYNKAKNT